MLSAPVQAPECTTSVCSRRQPSLDSAPPGRDSDDEPPTMQHGGAENAGLEINGPMCRHGICRTKIKRTKNAGVENVKNDEMQTLNSTRV